MSGCRMSYRFQGRSMRRRNLFHREKFPSIVRIRKEWLLFHLLPSRDWTILLRCDYYLYFFSVSVLMSTRWTLLIGLTVVLYLSSSSPLGRTWIQRRTSTDTHRLCLLRLRVSDKVKNDMISSDRERKMTQKNGRRNIGMKRRGTG